MCPSFTSIYTAIAIDERGEILYSINTELDYTCTAIRQYGDEHNDSTVYNEIIALYYTSNIVLKAICI